MAVGVGWTRRRPPQMRLPPWMVPTAGSHWRLTWTGLRALGMPEGIVGHPSDEFREGMLFPGLGIPGPHRHNAQHWVGGLAGDDLHADRDLVRAQCRRSIQEHDKLLARTDGVRNLSYLDLMRHRRSTMPMTTSAYAIGCRNR